MSQTKGMTIEEKFYFYADIPDDEDKCWLWQGPTMGGYGVINYPSRNPRKHLLAHRVAFVLLVAAIPEGKFILHRCNVPKCVNPNHLYPGGYEDNADDYRIYKERLEYLDSQPPG